MEKTVVCHVFNFSFHSFACGWRERRGASPSPTTPEWFCPTAPSTIGRKYIIRRRRRREEEVNHEDDLFSCSNDGLAGCAPVPQTGVLMLVSTCLLYFPTTMTLLYVYGTVFHSHNSSQRLVPTTTRSLPGAQGGSVKATSYECNDHCTDGYCNVNNLMTNSIVTPFFLFTYRSITTHN